MNQQALLKSLIWGVTGVILDKSITPPAKATTTDTRPPEGLLMKIIIAYGVPLFRSMSWYMSVVEILTIQSSGFRRITSYPTTSDPSIIDTPFLAAFTFLVLGFFLRMYSFRVLGDLFTLEVAIRPNHKLITHGPYRFVRHPSYTGLVSVIIGNMLLHYTVTDTWAVKWAFFLWAMQTTVATAKVWSRTINEDEMLRGKFGAEWVAYRERVPYRFVPGIL